MTGAPNPPEPENDRPIVLDYDLDAPPERLWRALTEPALVAAWLAPHNMSSDAIATEVGQRFVLQPTPDTPVDCEVLESEPTRRLSYGWRETPQGGRPLDSIVTFEITPQPGGGSHLRLVHRERDVIDGGLVGALGGLPGGGANDNGTIQGGSLAWAA